VWERISYAPTGAIVRGAHDLARELLAVWYALWVGQESATVVVYDVVLVLAGLAHSSISDGKHVIVVLVVVPKAFVSAVHRSKGRVDHKPHEDLGSVRRVATGQGDASAAADARLNAVQPGSVPIRHDDVWLLRSLGAVI